MTKKLNPRRHEEIVRLRNAEELFEIVDRDAMRHSLVGYNPEYGPVLAGREPYTPPSNVLAARKHEVEYKGRDYKALTEAAKRKPVGYWADAPRGMKFTVTPVPLAEAKAKIASAAAPVAAVRAWVCVDGWARLVGEADTFVRVSAGSRISLGATIFSV